MAYHIEREIAIRRVDIVLRRRYKRIRYFKRLLRPYFGVSYTKFYRIIGETDPTHYNPELVEDLVTDGLEKAKKVMRQCDLR